MHDTADKYDCNRFFKYNHNVKSAVWSEQKSKWDLKVDSGDGTIIDDEVDVFVNAGGILK
jgi:cation diffusion facilitator CzcD-associated flavoprotein CzcO